MQSRWHKNTRGVFSVSCPSLVKSFYCPMKTSPFSFFGNACFFFRTIFFASIISMILFISCDAFACNSQQFILFCVSITMTTQFDFRLTTQQSFCRSLQPCRQGFIQSALWPVQIGDVRQNAHIALSSATTCRQGFNPDTLSPEHRWSPMSPLVVQVLRRARS
jgi:hypothetical protein